ncbi:SDR family NAD(P)-dependent oxidoreductase, partial [Nostoc cf. edaphicum LEGE 07299]
MSDVSEKVHQLSSLQQMLLALKEARLKLEAVERSKSEPIAIIGMGCRFPGGANDPETFWQLLHDGVDAITEIPPQRWDIDDFYDPDPNTPGKMYIRKAGFLQQVDQFDPQFFGISPREALSMDPQQRLLLEVCWEALENAGIAPNKLSDSQTGVFLGIGQNDYAQLQLYSGEHTRINTYDGTGNGLCFASGRLSYVLGLQGPSVAIDTACSSSLVAIHLACQSLRAGECSLALAAGVQMILSPEVTIFLSRAQALSPDGRCKTFDAAANGYGRGEGCGVIVLKRLHDAIANGDNILALIRGSAVNHDGSSSGLTVPNKQAQQALLCQALANAKVEPSQVSYIEAHGTGTPLGDPIEIRALAAVLGEGRSPEKPLIIGSVKTNIGHLESASGIAGLIKVVLALQHKEIPPHLHFHNPNPYINWNELPVVVPTATLPWKNLTENQRIAGVSSFGMSGTNAHVVLEEAPSIEPANTKLKRPVHLLTLSAKTEQALQQLAQRYEKHLVANPALDIGNICWSANTGRSHFQHRLSVVAESTQQLREKLATFTAGQEPAAVFQAKASTQPKVAFLFTGQGSQYVGMGHQLYQTQPVFRQALDRCEQILRPYLQKPLLSVLFPEAGETSPLDETAYTQPALFALEYALFEVWKSWGITADAVMGHSVGEYVAACVAGVFSLEDGLKLIAQRGRLMQSLPENGEMVVVFAQEKLVAAAIEPYSQQVAIAAINGPENIVISGERQAVAAIVTTLEVQGVSTKKLVVSHAFHSPLMEPILADFAHVAQQVIYSSPRIELISNLTGMPVKTEIMTPEYWVNHLRQTVQFTTSIKTLHQQGYEVFVECGPKPTLSSMGRQCLPEAVGVWLPSLRFGQDWYQMLQSLAQLYVRGASVDWSAFERDYLRCRLQLPTYPFQHQRYWCDSSVLQARKSFSYSQERIATLHPLFEKKLQSPLIKEIVLESQFSTHSLPFLKDHRIYEQIIVPGASHLSMLLAANELSFGTEKCVLEDVFFPEALALPEKENCTLQLVITPENKTEYSFKLISLESNVEDKESSYVVHATGKILTTTENEVNSNNAGTSKHNLIEELQARCPQNFASTQLFQILRQHQIQLGATFQCIESIWLGNEEVLGLIRVPEGLDELEKYQLHPTLIDSCFQLLLVILPIEEEETLVPFHIERFQFHRRLCSSQLWCHVRLQRHVTEGISEEKLVGEIQLLNYSGQVIAEVIGLESRKISQQALLRHLQKDLENWLYEIAWQPAISEYNPQKTDINKQGSWLIFADGKGIGLNIAKRLRECGEHCVLVFPGQTYEVLEGEKYYINPRKPKDFQQLLQAILQNNHISYRGIVHLWSLDETPYQTSDLTVLQDTQVFSCCSVLHLVQAMNQAQWSEFPRLWLVTRGTQFIELAPTSLNLHQAPLWGLGRTIALEHPEYSCVCLDLDPLGNDEDVIKSVFSELRYSDTENQVAWRQGVRYLARLVRCSFKVSRQRIHEDSSYLITGGLGALGLKVAHWLVEQGARYLVLTGRNQPSAAAQEKVKLLEQAGVQVLVVKTDVSNQEDVAKMLGVVETSMRPLRGIVHAAGLLDDG